MPSLSHEALVRLFRNRPELAAELLHEALGVELPAYTSVRIESAELTQVVPTTYHADLVVLLVEDRPVLGIVVEAQLSTKRRKRFTWPPCSTASSSSPPSASSLGASKASLPQRRLLGWAASKRRKDASRLPEISLRLGSPRYDQKVIRSPSGPA